MKTFVSQMMHLLSTPGSRPELRALVRFFVVLTVVITLFAVTFHLLMLREGQEFSWLTGFYWTLTVMSTLGFGDITFHSDVGRAFTMVVLLTGVILLLIVLPFVFIRHFYAPWLEAQLKAKAPRRVGADMRGHVIVCSYNDVAKGLADRLAFGQVKTVMLEPDPARATALQDEKVHVVCGAVDARGTFEAAGIERARLLVANMDDETNTNIVVTAREVSDAVSIVATVTNPDAADVVELAGATKVVLVGRTLGEQLASRVSAGSAQAHIVGRYRNLAIAEFPIRHTKLAGQTLAGINLRARTGVTVTALAKRGHLEPALPDTPLREDCIGVAAGDEEQLKALNDYLCDGLSQRGPVLVIGGGRVGGSAAASLRARGVDVRVIEENPDLLPGLETIVDDIVIGDAADRRVIDRSGIDEASSVILTTNNDATNIFLTVYCRKLNPDTIIVSRVNQLRNIESIHRAGADFAVSDAQIQIQSVLSVLEGRQPVILGEGLDLFKVEVPKSLDGKMLKETGILARTGLAVCAVERGGVVDAHPRPDTRLRRGELVLFVGTASQRHAFERVFA